MHLGSFGLLNNPQILLKASDSYIENTNRALNPISTLKEVETIQYKEGLMANRSLLGISLAVAFAVTLFGGLAMAASNECSRVGMWHGEGDQGFTWMVPVSAGADATNGQFTVEWIVIDPTLGGMFTEAVRVTNGFGVWKKVNKHTYQYTWIAYGLAQDGMVIYTARASGIESMVDCDHFDVTYVLELWLGAADVSVDEPIFYAPGTATERRMPLVQASCPAP